MAGDGEKRVFPVDTAHAIRGTQHHGGALVVWLIGLLSRARGNLELLPGLLELGPVPLGAVAIEELAVGFDAAGNHCFAGFHEDRPALLAVRVEQRIGPPALEGARELPAQVGHVFQAGVEAKPPYGGWLWAASPAMKMRSK